jgi:hypothetical protein
VPTPSDARESGAQDAPLAIAKVRSGPNDWSGEDWLLALRGRPLVTDRLGRLRILIIGPW